MRSLPGLIGLMLLMGIVGTPAVAIEEIAPGVTYTVYSAAGPNNVHVVKVDRLRSEYTFKIGLAQGKRNYTAREPVPTIVTHYHNPPAQTVLTATNGSYFDGVTLPRFLGVSQTDGDMLDTPGFDSYTYHTFMVGPSRQPVVVTNFNHVPGTITFPDGYAMTLTQYNFNMNGTLYPINGVAAFTPNFDSSTRSSFISPSLAAEVVLNNVSYPMRGDKEISGIIGEIYSPTSGNAAIPAGGMVLTAWGATKSEILAHAHIGERIKVRVMTGAEEFNNSDNALTGIGWIIHNGAAYPTGWQNLQSGAYVDSRAPRTVLAWNRDYWFQVVIDGRGAGGSVGMTFQEIANFLIGTLGATEAVNYDGGGSATMVVNGTVRNIPSDGSPRYVANAIMLVKRDVATAFPVTDSFAATGRIAGWDDKFYYADVVPFSPSSPGGDGYVLKVINPNGGVNTVRRGDFGDQDYAVQADIYCEYRPDVAADGFERYALFARDSGTAALGLANYGGGNCYALTYDSDSGRIQAGKYNNGILTDFLASPLYMPSTAWRTFRIECRVNAIKYLVDGNVIAAISDSDHPRGYFGLGYHESFATNSLMNGTRADHFVAQDNTGPVPPTPEFSATPTSGLAPLTVQFTDQSSGSIDSWSWNFGDNTPDSDVQSPAHTYLLPGQYTVSLTVMGPGGTSTRTRSAYIEARPSPGDLDGDNDVDLDDFGRLQRCLTGPGSAQTSPSCRFTDLDGDLDVDRYDVNLFIGCMSGAGIAADPSCLGNR